MAFTFDATLADPLDRVRQMLGDVTDAGHLVENETIAYYLSTRSELAAATQLARDLAARFAGLVDTDLDGQGFKNSQRYRQFKALANDLQTQLDREASTSQADADAGGGFCGIGVYGATAQEVIDARADCTAATNAPLKW